MTWYYNDVKVGDADDAGMYASAMLESDAMDLWTKLWFERGFKEYLDTHYTSSDVLEQMASMGFDTLADCVDALFIGYVACELDRCKGVHIPYFGPFNWRDE